MTTRSSLRAVAAAGLLLAIAGSPVAADDLPTPGTPDATFGADGVVSATFASTLAMDGVLRQPDGRLVVVGTVGSGPSGLDAPYAFGLTRLDPDGSVDTGFGVDGRVTTPMGNDGLALPLAAALQSDGSILVGGGVGRSGITQADLVRYTPDGEIDATFGVDGVAELVLPQGGYIDRIVVRDDDRIMLSGASDERDREWMLARLLPDGAPDPAFGADGIVLTGETADGGYAMVVPPDGGVTATNGTILARFDATGRQDPAFGTGGVVPIDFGGGPAVGGVFALTAGAEGSVIVGGRLDGGTPSMALARYDVSGALDATFGSNGVVLPDVGTAAQGAVQDLAVDPVGRLLVTGDSDDDVVLLRLGADGSPDTGFGTGGVARLAMGQSSYPVAVSLQPDGAIVVAASPNSLLPEGPWRVARFLGSASPTVPGATTGVTAVADGASAIVTWTAPVSDGGSPITGYAVTASPGGATCITDGEPGCTTSGLADGSYTFTVIATNAVGPGPASQPSPELVIDTTPPTTPGAPAATLAVGSTIGTTVPVALSWAPSDDETGVARYEVWLSVNGEPYVLVASPVAPARSWSLRPSSTTYYRFRVRAVDAAGNPSAFRAGPSFHVRRIQQSSGTVRYGGSWSRISAASASGGSLDRTSIAGRSATLTFHGRAVAVVAKTGTSFGSLRVYVDGKRVATVSQHTATTAWRRVVVSRSWPTTGTHTIRLVCAGTAGHPRVNLDAFVVLD